MRVEIIDDATDKNFTHGLEVGEKAIILFMDRDGDYKIVVLPLFGTDYVGPNDIRLEKKK